MNILALDTTTRGGSVALARAGSVVAVLAGDPALTHGQRLPGDLLRTLEQGGMRIEDVDLLAVAAGPGSFTGLRVGIAAIQGIAVARRLRVVPVPTLEALAASEHFVASADPLVASADPRVASADPLVASADPRVASADPRVASADPLVASADPRVASAFRRKADPLVASAFRRKDTLVAAWMDGHRGEVFAAIYGDLPPEDDLPPEGGSHTRIEGGSHTRVEGGSHTRIEGGSHTRIEGGSHPRIEGGSHTRIEGGSHTHLAHPYLAGRPEAVLDAWKLPDDAAVTFIGDGAVRYRAVIEERFGRRARVVDPPDLAPIVARIAFEQPQRAVEPHEIVPIYVRRPDAELARDRREGRA